MNIIETEATRLIGISLPKCVEEIASGKVEFGAIDYIISMTEISSDDQWKHYLENVCCHFWSDPSKFKDVFWRLMSVGKIRQPRLHNSFAGIPDVQQTGRIWVNSEIEIRFRKMPVRDKYRARICSP